MKSYKLSMAVEGERTSFLSGKLPTLSKRFFNMQLQKLIQIQAPNELEVFLTTFTHVALFDFTTVLVMNTPSTHSIVPYDIKTHFLTF